MGGEGDSFPHSAPYKGGRCGGRLLEGGMCGVEIGVHLVQGSLGDPLGTLGHLGALGVCPWWVGTRGWRWGMWGGSQGVWGVGP